MRKNPAASDYRPTYRWAISVNSGQDDHRFHYVEADGEGQPSLDSYDSPVCVWPSKRTATAALAALLPEGVDGWVYGGFKVRRVDTGAIWDICQQMSA